MKHVLKTTKQLLVVTTLLVLLTWHDSQAQFGFAIGPKGGVGLTTFRGADADELKGRTNWLGGVFMNFQLGRAFALQPELLLTERGGQVTSNNVRTDISINYFEVPVLAKLRLPLANEVIFPHILFGPNFAFQTDLDLSGTDTQSGAVVEADADGIRNTDIGALLGAGIDIQTRGTGVFFTIDGRYGWSFSDLYDNDNMIAIRNAGWQFAVGVGFRIGDSRSKFD